MFKKDSLATDDQCTSRGFNMQGGHNFFPEIRSTRNQYDRLDKFDNEVKASTQYIPRTHYSPLSKNDFKIGTSNHLQDLNEKFQELESKMFEVEKCFKEANKREMDEVQRLVDNDDIKSSSGSVHNVQRSRLFEVTESRKETSVFPSEGINEWLGKHNSIGTEKKSFENRITKNGCGDEPTQFTNRLSSQDSCKTLIKSLEKSPDYLFNRHGAKGIFTIDQLNVEQHEPSKHYISEEEYNKSTADVDFLEKSKKLILTLIDKELKKIETKPIQSNINPTTDKSDNSRDQNKNLKLECINNIERELQTLKKLESLEL